MAARPGLLIETTSKRDFHAAVSAVDEAISAAGGWIVSHQFYSNTLAMISFQIPANALAAFGDRLASSGIDLHEPLPDLTARTGDVAAQVSISFRQDGDIRRAVPAFG